MKFQLDATAVIGLFTGYSLFISLWSTHYSPDETSKNQGFQWICEL